MYCSFCAAPVAPGISFCNRCGASLKKDEEKKGTGAINAFLTAIALLGVIGLGIMLGGALKLKEANLESDIIGVFMVFTFLIVAITEMLLVRQLSKLMNRETTQIVVQPPPAEFAPPQARALAEPVPSVTENTTRTLEYTRNEGVRQ